MRRAAVALVVAIAAITVGLPLLGVAVRMAWRTNSALPEPTGAAAPGGTPATISTIIGVTLGVPMLIAAGAVVLAWPTCWLLRSSGRATRAALALLLVPMLMPSYLAYSGFGLARAPGTWIGEIVNRWPSEANVLFGKSLAVGGLMLWCWPFATIALLGPVRRIDQEHLDQLTLTSPGWWPTLVQRAAMVRGSLLATFALITLLMLGSALPLHLALIPTLAIDLWARLALAPTSTAVWFSAWPLVIIAVVGSILLTRWIAADEPHESRTHPPPRSRASSWLFPIVAWCFAVAVPLALFAQALHHSRPLTDFWLEHAQSVGDSLAVAAAVGGVLIVLAMAAWYAAEHPRSRRVVVMVLGLQLVGLLLPGVLIGSAVGGLLNHPVLGSIGRWVADSTGVVVLGHVARFGALGTAAGLWLARLEAPNLRDARRLAAGESGMAWLALAVRPQVATLLGVGVAGGCLSLHEIEATVQLQPPGYLSLAQVMLDHLHMNSVQELAAAGINVLGLGVIMAGAGGWLLGREPASRIGAQEIEPGATNDVPNR